MNGRQSLTLLSSADQTDDRRSCADGAATIHDCFVPPYAAVSVTTAPSFSPAGRHHPAASLRDSAAAAAAKMRSAATQTQGERSEWQRHRHTVATPRPSVRETRSCNGGKVDVGDRIAAQRQFQNVHFQASRNHGKFVRMWHLISEVISDRAVFSRLYTSQKRQYL